ncbi:MAG: transporter substrate-binding domain-containing protein, partial [Gammaproteobacteria bacterium]|nr:transporter substrate-binding domain-containing protein [Gammaproteobacteria bacterium]
AAAAPVRVCVDGANPTMPMDMRIARAAAKTQGLSLRFVRFTGYGKGGDGFPIGRFATMAGSRCALIMGFPVDVSDPHLPPRVAATAAYASTGFVLVRRAGAPDVSLGKMPGGSEVGIAQLDTYAGTLYAQHPNIVMHVYPRDTDMLAALAARRISAGLAWQPSIERYIRAHHEARFDVRILPGRHMLWNLVALYSPESKAAADWFDASVAALRKNGRLAALTKPYQEAAAVAPPGPPALYTESQAARGALAYYQNCAMCHGPLLNGQEGGYSGPALKGADFADPSYDFHVSDIFNFVAKLMPAATPGSLKPDVDVAIMAFLLKQNGYPAGERPLSYDEAAKSSVALRFYGK